MLLDQFNTSFNRSAQRAARFDEPCLSGATPRGKRFDARADGHCG
jgi:hypothetical protein